MKALGKGCFELIVVWAAAGYALFQWFQGSFEAPGDLYGAVGGGCLIAMAWGSLRGAFQAQSQRKIIAAAKSGARPEDGKLFAAAGTIRAVREILTTPIDKKECVVFGYTVSCEREYSSSSDSSKSKYNEMLMGGFAMVPCLVRTPIADIRICGFPVPSEFPEQKLPAEPKRDAILEYVKSNTFGRDGTFAITEMLSQLKSAFMDDDGHLREEWKSANLEARLDGEFSRVTYSEQYVPNLAPVCVLGKYSAQKGGIVSDLSMGGIQIFPGDASAADRSLRTKFISGVFFFLLFGALGGVGVRAILEARERSPEIVAHHRDRLVEAIDRVDIEGVKTELKHGNKVLPAGSDLARVIERVSSKEILALLVANGLSLEDSSDDGRTPLLNAIYAENVPLVAMLLELGANPNTKQVGYGNSPLDLAFDSGNRELYQLILKAGGEGVFVTAKTGSALDSNSEPVRALQRFLNAFVATDTESLRQLSYQWPESFFESFSRGIYKESRSDTFSFLRGFGNDQAATVIISSPSSSGATEIWMYTLVNKGDGWRVTRDHWDDKGRWAPKS